MVTSTPILDLDPPTGRPPSRSPERVALRRLSRDDRGEIDALDLLLVAIILGAAAVALVGPHEALRAAQRTATTIAGWLD